MDLSRRNFLGLMGVGVTGTILASCLKKAYSVSTEASSLIVSKFGALKPDPKGILDLPAGLQYKILSVAGETMDDGLLVPNHHDGMGAFAGENGTTILVRNHELSPIQIPNNLAAEIPQYDPLCPGCTTTLIIDRDRNLQQHYLSLAGTNRNCSGGVTTWNSWISCEEEIATPYAPPGYSLEEVLPYWGKVSKKHGYNFEVPVKGKIAQPKPLKAMGRFRHEAIAIDPKTGYIYQTEDRNNSCFYRFRPQEAGNLSAGGILEAMVIKEMPTVDTGLNFPLNEAQSIDWVKIEDVDPEHDSLRYEAQAKGGAIFRRGEGMCYADGEFYFTCTNGGQAGVGQIFRYNPTQETVELFLESPGIETLDYPDNLTLAPFGDLIVCEDGRGEQRLIGVTPEGESYQFARNALNNSEFAGVCFAPDGKTMFVNIYSPGMTLAIYGL
ncbi:alkaline phosphatase PhoX [Hyella patelloides]|uniref:alkaline phosphatase PhoX n=1 Tax=Hyella patelloides TaxID=1982969 RepID=UPI0011A3B108|nr:alkaline phosphatase PhoX [Hyella patelloides]